jgi:hypothetical protein
MSLLVGMEIVDLFTAIIVATMILEAYARIQLNKKAGNVLYRGEEELGKTADVPKNIDSDLMGLPTPPNEWSPGLGSFLSTRPMLIFFVLIIVLAGALSSVVLIATAPKLLLAVLALILGMAFHSGPDRYTLFEYFIQFATTSKIESLGDNELGLLSQAKHGMQYWALLQACFAVGLLAGVLMPIDYAASYILGFYLITFLILGHAYQIQKGIFAGPQ